MRRDTARYRPHPGSVGAPSRASRTRYASVIELQRAIGNKRFARLIAAQRRLSRDPKKPPPLPIDPPGKSPIDAPTGPGIKLTPEDRGVLADAAASRILVALDAFSSAVQREQAAIKAEAKARAEAAALVLDIFFGLAAPVVSQWIIAGGGSKLVTKLASVLSAGGKTPGVEQIKPSDLIKEGLKGLGKYATKVVKSDLETVLYGEEKPDTFAAELRRAFRQGVVGITDELAVSKVAGKGFTDEELVTLFLAYDPDVASEEAYLEILGPTFKHFEKLVAPIGHDITDTTDVTFDETVRGVWVSPGPYGKTRLAVIGNYKESSSYGDPKDDDFFVGWVTKDVEPYVIRKTEQFFGRVETVPLLLLPRPVPEPTELSDEERRVKERWKAGPRRPIAAGPGGRTPIRAGGSHDRAPIAAGGSQRRVPVGAGGGPAP